MDITIVLFIFFLLFLVIKKSYKKMIFLLSVFVTLVYLLLAGKYLFGSLYMIIVVSFEVYHIFSYKNENVISTKRDLINKSMGIIIFFIAALLMKELFLSNSAEIVKVEYGKIKISSMVLFLSLFMILMNFKHLDEK